METARKLRETLAFFAAVSEDAGFKLLALHETAGDSSADGRAERARTAVAGMRDADVSEALTRLTHLIAAGDDSLVRALIEKLDGSIDNVQREFVLQAISLDMTALLGRGRIAGKDASMRRG